MLTKHFKIFPFCSWDHFQITGNKQAHFDHVLGTIQNVPRFQKILRKNVLLEQLLGGGGQKSAKVVYGWLLIVWSNYT